VPYLLGGAWLSLQIAFLAFCGGMVIGLFGAMAMTYGSVWVRRPVAAYVSFFTNTPQLVQIYFIFSALPDWGILFSPYTAVLIGMTLNAGAYLTQVQRAGFASVHRAEIEAATTLGFTRMQSVRFVILPHIMKTLFPPLSNLYILMTLGTSMAAVFGVEELTGRAFNVSLARLSARWKSSRRGGHLHRHHVCRHLAAGGVGKHSPRADEPLLGRDVSASANHRRRAAILRLFQHAVLVAGAGGGVPAVARRLRTWLPVRFRAGGCRRTTGWRWHRCAAS
jgi:polar amino acid transport system permease protein